MSKLINAVWFVGLAQFLSGCDQWKLSETTSAGEPPKAASVTIAKPREYTSATPDDLLGVNQDDKGLEVGHKLADLTVMDIEGKPYALSSAWSDKPALVVFYRGGWCPFCNLQVRDLSVNYDKFVTAGVQPILISVDEPDKAAMLDATYEIPFPVLSDSDLAAHSAFNVLLEIDAATQEKYKEYGIDLEQWSGRDHGTVAVSSAFLIGQDGRVQFSHAPSDYSTRPSVEQLLMLVDNKRNSD